MSRHALPGFNTPAVGFEQPYEMLESCHSRVQRTLDLLQRLVAHVQAHGHDTQSCAAAADVLRYFDIAAPLHHADEELHVFPLLQASDDASLHAAVVSLQADHRQMETCWAALRQPLLRWREPGCTDNVSPQWHDTLQQFLALYQGHMALEEGQVFPAARARTDAPTLAAMSQHMQARRQA